MGSHLESHLPAGCDHAEIDARSTAHLGGYAVSMGFLLFSQFRNQDASEPFALLTCHPSAAQGPYSWVPGLHLTKIETPCRHFQSIRNGTIIFINYKWDVPVIGQ